MRECWVLKFTESEMVFIRRGKQMIQNQYFMIKHKKKRVKLRDPHSNIDCKFQPKSSCLHDSQTVYMPFLWPWSLRFFVVVTQRARERLLKRISRKSPHKSKTRKNLYLFAKAKFTVYHISYWRKKSEWGGHAIMWKKAQKMRNWRTNNGKMEHEEEHPANCVNCNKRHTRR